MDARLELITTSQRPLGTTELGPRASIVLMVESLGGVVR
jgi:hypothetical protein